MKKILLFVLLIVGFPRGAVLTVCPSGCTGTSINTVANGGGNFDTIQINSAADTVRNENAAIVLKTGQLLLSQPGRYDTLKFDPNGIYAIDPSGDSTRLSNICIYFNNSGPSGTNYARESYNLGGFVDSNVTYIYAGTNMTGVNCFHFAKSSATVYEHGRLVDCRIIGFAGNAFRWDVFDTSAQPNYTITRCVFTNSEFTVPHRSVFSYNVVRYDGESSLGGGDRSEVCYNYFSNIGGDNENVTMDNSAGFSNWYIHDNVYDSCSHVKLSIDGARGGTTIKNERYDTTFAAVAYDMYTHSDNQYDTCYNWTVANCYFKNGYNVARTTLHHHWLNLRGLMMVSGADLNTDSVYNDTLRRSLWFGTKGAIPSITIPNTTDTASGVSLTANISEGSRYPFVKQIASNYVNTRMAAGDTIGPLLYLTNKIARITKNDTVLSFACSLSYGFAWSDPVRGDSGTVRLQDSSAAGTWAYFDSSVNLRSRVRSATNGAVIGKRDTLVRAGCTAGSIHKFRMITTTTASGITFADTSFAWFDTTTGGGADCDSIRHIAYTRTATTLSDTGAIACDTADTIKALYATDTSGTIDTTIFTGVGSNGRKVLNKTGITPSDTVYVRWIDSVKTTAWIQIVMLDSISDTVEVPVCGIPGIDSTLSESTRKDSVRADSSFQVFGIEFKSTGATWHLGDSTLAETDSSDTVWTLTCPAGMPDGDYDLYMDDSCGNRSDTLTVTVWSPPETPSYTLTVTDNGAGGTTTPAGAVEVDSGAGTAIQADSAAHYGFRVWRVTSGSGVTFADSTAATTTCTLSTGNATVSAIFALIPATQTPFLTSPKRTISSLYNSVVASKQYAIGEIDGIGFLDTAYKNNTRFINRRNNDTNFIIIGSGTVSSDVNHPMYKMFNRPFWRATATGAVNLSSSASSTGLNNVTASVVSLNVYIPDTVNTDTLRGIVAYGLSEATGYGMYLYHDSLVCYAGIGTTPNWHEFAIALNRITWLRTNYLMSVSIRIDTENRDSTKRVNFFLDGVNLTSDTSIVRFHRAAKYYPPLNARTSEQSIYFGNVRNVRCSTPINSGFNNIRVTLNRVSDEWIMMTDAIFKNTTILPWSGESNMLVSGGVYNDGVENVVKSGGKMYTTTNDLYDLHAGVEDYKASFSEISKRKRYQSSGSAAPLVVNYFLDSIKNDVLVLRTQVGGIGLTQGAVQGILSGDTTNGLGYWIQPSDVNLTSNKIKVECGADSGHFLYADRINWYGLFGSLGYYQPTDSIIGRYMRGESDSLPPKYHAVKTDHDSIGIASSRELALAGVYDVDLTVAPTDSMYLCPAKVWLNRLTILRKKRVDDSTPPVGTILCFSNTLNLLRVIHVSNGLNTTTLVCDWVARRSPINRAPSGTEFIYALKSDTAYPLLTIANQFIDSDGDSIRFFMTGYREPGSTYIYQASLLSMLGADKLPFFVTSTQADAFDGTGIYQGLDTMREWLYRDLKDSIKMFIPYHNATVETRAFPIKSYTSTFANKELLRWVNDNSNYAKILYNSTPDYIAKEYAMNFNVRVDSIPTGCWLRKKGNNGAPNFRLHFPPHDDFIRLVKADYNCTPHLFSFPDTFLVFWDNACTDTCKVIPFPYYAIITGASSSDAHHYNGSCYLRQGNEAVRTLRNAYGDTSVNTQPPLFTMQESNNDTININVSTASGSFTTEYELTGKGLQHGWQGYNPSYGWVYADTGFKVNSSTLSLVFPHTVNGVFYKQHHFYLNSTDIPDDTLGRMYRDSLVCTNPNIRHLHNFKNQLFSIKDSVYNTYAYSFDSVTGVPFRAIPLIDSIRPNPQWRSDSASIYGARFLSAGVIRNITTVPASDVSQKYWSNTRLDYYIPPTWPRGWNRLVVTNSDSLRDTLSQYIAIIRKTN